MFLDIPLTRQKKVILLEAVPTLLLGGGGGGGLVQSMYKDARSRVRADNGYSEEFGVGVGVISVLSSALFFSSLC